MSHPMTLPTSTVSVALAPTVTAAKTSRTVALSILDVLAEYGIDTVFGIPGGAISRIYSELPSRPNIKVVNAVHETNAVFLAMGHARATGRPAVALVTSGPGVTNALTGLASAHADGVPVLLIAGEVARSAFGRGALQEGSSHGFDALAMARPITKFAAQLVRPTVAATTVRKALATMTTGRVGPAFISLPLDVASAEVEPSRHTGSPSLSFRVDRGACIQAAELLAKAERPLILAGAGARSPVNRTLLAELARRAQAPVAVTPKGKGVFAETDPLYLGVLGFGGHESVIHYLEAKPDVVVVLGSSLNDFSTNAWTPLLQASRAFIHVDIDAVQIGKNYPADIGILGPIHEVVVEMLAGMPAVGARAAQPTVSYQAPPRSAHGGLTTPDTVLAMNELCPKDAVFTSDMGEHLGVALHYLRTGPGGSFMTALGFGSMGSGVVGSIGHALGDPSRRVFALCGDGGFLMSGNELQTAVKHHANVTFVIINDGRFNMCHHGMREQYGVAPDCTLGVVDFARIAGAFGAEGHVATDAASLAEALKRRGGPVVIDVRVDPDVRLSNNTRIAGLRQFSHETR